MMRFICFLIGSGSLIGMMLLVRMVLRRRISPRILYALWLIPAVRLLVPFALIPVPVLPEVMEEAAETAEDASGIIGGTAKNAGEVSGTRGETVKNAEKVSEAAEETVVDAPVIYEGDAEGDISEVINNANHMQDAQNVHDSETGKMAGNFWDRNMLENKTAVQSTLLCIWASGCILCGSYVLWVNGRLKKRIKQMRRLPKETAVPVYIQKEQISPCLFGLFHPCILLSEQIAESGELCDQILLHEETHYRQKDHIWTALRIFLCVVYWWNPLVWLGAACAREDAEFACDARALRGALLSEKKVYGYALLEIMQKSQNAGTLVQGISPVSGKGKNMKRRLENIVSENSKTRLWMLPACLLLLLFLCGFCFPAQRVRAEGEMMQGIKAANGVKEAAADESGREKEAAEEKSGGEKEAAAGKPGEEKETTIEKLEEAEREDRSDTINRTETATAENAEDGRIDESRAEGDEERESERGIRLHPQGHREGYREPDLSYTASVDWLTDLSAVSGEQKRVEALAKRALRELYDLTGYQVENCYYGYNEIGMLSFARSEEDMARSRVFYSYALGEKDGYDIISSIDIVSARRVWYSDVQQLALPENAESMTKEELAVWFLEHSPLCPEGIAVKIEPVSGNGADFLKLTMEDGTFYEIYLDMEILAVNNIYGPYPKDAHH